MRSYNASMFRGIAIVLLLSYCAPLLSGQSSSGLNAAEATKLASLMCRQLPNLASFPETVVVLSPQDPKVKSAMEKGYWWDDVYDTLILLGQYSVPCLVDRMADIRWMPDPRMEPLLGAPVVGDIAYMVLKDKEVPDLLPALAHKNAKDMRMDDWFLWPSIGSHRLQLQTAVRAWLRKHPECCAAREATRDTALPNPILRMSTAQRAQAQERFARLRSGMTVAQVLKVLGEPDGKDSYETYRGTEDTHLLGIGSADRNENLAYIYFVERWTKDIKGRGLLHVLHRQQRAVIAS